MTTSAGVTFNVDSARRRNSRAALAFGVLLDTMIVRSVLVTALTLDVGRWMWWPSKLFKHHEPEPPAGEANPEPASLGAGR